MKKIITIIFLSLFVFSVGNLALAQNEETNQDSYGLDKTAGQVDAYKNDVDAKTTYDEAFVAQTVGDVIGIVLSFVGVLFLLLIIYGGISWMFSGGNEQKVQKAQGIIINAVIGLVIVFAAYFITDFIGSQFVN
jgi:hypothetical protein